MEGPCFEKGQTFSGYPGARFPAALAGVRSGTWLLDVILELHTSPILDGLFRFVYPVHWTSDGKKEQENRRKAIFAPVFPA